MRRSFLGRLFVTALCLMLLINVVAAPFAMAAVDTAKKEIRVSTLNVKSFKKVSKITICNTQGSLENLIIKVKDRSGCTVSPKSAIIEPGKSKTFTITTYFGNSGSFKLVMTNEWTGCTPKATIVDYSGLEGKPFIKYASK